MKQRLQDRTFSLLLTITIIIILFSAVYPSLFPTPDNLKQVLLNLSVETIVAVGMMLLMISGSFDLSVGSVAAFSGGLCAWLMYFQHVNVAVALVTALLASICIGLINGYFVAHVGVNPLIQTLAMMGIVRGLALMVGGAGIQGLPFWFNAIGQSKLLGLQMPIWYMAATVILFAFLFRKTVFFRRYYYIGNNEKAAMLSGINVKKMKVISFVITSLLAGAAGILLSSRLGAALSTSGEGMELRVITAAILGGASLNGGAGKITGAFLGAVFMALISNIMTISRISGYWQQIILGVILISAICIDLLLKKEKVAVTKP